MERRGDGKNPMAITDGDHEHDAELCRVLDAIVRIIFEVSVIDHYIEIYLAKIEIGSSSAREKDRSAYMNKVGRMAVNVRFEKVSKSVREMDVVNLLEDVKEIKDIRNAMAH